MSVISSGLKITSFQEYGFGFFQRYSHLKKNEDDKLFYQDPNYNLKKIPYLFSLMATKDS